MKNEQISPMEIPSAGQPETEYSYERQYLEIGRLYGLGGMETKKVGAVHELEQRSRRCNNEYTSSMKIIKEEVDNLAGAFRKVNQDGIEQLQNLQQYANTALQQFVTATEILTKMNLNEQDRTRALDEVRRASLEMVNSIQDAITDSLKMINQFNDRLRGMDIIGQANSRSEAFLNLKLQAEHDLFALEKGYLEGDSIRQSLSGSPQPALPLISLPQTISS
ncbi:hypothetical protein [Flavilitoribacter nigricans]|uniref:Uncharacterized protein n=1 Tax=Flavilitoribacter nigricans (strain ATCC 23147 / DSM 23189 / NBRC 102662 / NCIMB 1420 / SS-2) TaxID=1122177 RepID=A0A2D0N1D5_FLAN2|nr:hypothetical protein [Flavilitoribacter nigricans]PHN02240.1 hypothetical protein CRP01_33440 [Flavilitoribacter nigricans DSM 23189 = NBRC 102662]